MRSLQLIESIAKRSSPESVDHHDNGFPKGVMVVPSARTEIMHCMKSLTYRYRKISDLGNLQYFPFVGYEMTWAMWCQNIGGGRTKYFS